MGSSDHKEQPTPSKETSANEGTASSSSTASIDEKNAPATETDGALVCLETPKPEESALRGNAVELSQDEDRDEKNRNSPPEFYNRGPDDNVVNKKEDAPTEGKKDAIVGTPEDEKQAEGGTEDEGKYLSGLPLLVLVVALCLVTFLIGLDQMILATAIPRITSQFHSLPDVGWYGSAYLLTTTSLQPSYGKVYTFFNVKYTFLSAMAIFERKSTQFVF